MTRSIQEIIYCDHCNKVTEEATVWEMSTSQSPKKKSIIDLCPKCDAMLNDWYTLGSGPMPQPREKKYICQVCGFQGKTSRGVKVHESMMHKEN